MNKIWLVSLLLALVLTACVDTSEAQNPSQIRATATSTSLASTPTLPQLPIPPDTSATEVPNALSPRWQYIATQVAANVQQAIDKSNWEDAAFKKRAYDLCEELIATSPQAQLEDSENILKYFRWGMEFMDKRQLQEALQILEKYN